ncbi:MAG: glutamate--tRNA ligase [Nitrososphaerota archaeon]
MVTDESRLRLLLYKWALKNALDHGGRAQEKPVIAKVVAEDPGAKVAMSFLLREVKAVVERVNAMSLEEIAQALSEIDPSLLTERRAREERRTLPPLPNAVKGNVVTRLPPEPSGFMHIGHALSGLLNYLYKEMYGGKLWLRFEDTDPRKVRPEYYDSYRDGYSWVGIRWDHEKNNSDDMELFYEHARRLIEEGKAYACTCDRERMRRLRAEGVECEHRSREREWHLEMWDGMLSGRFGEGEVSLRLMGDMRSANTTLRDPVIMRIVDHPHPLKGDRYHVWPTYDFAVSIEDAVCGVTHVLRTSEFALRNELQDLIRSYLGMPNPTYVEYERFEFEGTPVARREIRALIEKGVIGGWDDPRLATVAAIRRRGIVPEALREFVLRYVAMTQSRKVYSWELLHAINRRLIDGTTPRMFFVDGPALLKLRGFEPVEVELPLHPEGHMGTRKIRASGELYVRFQDLLEVGVGGVLRLKHLANVRVLEIGDGRALGEALPGPPEPGMRVVQWVPVESAVPVRVLVPGPLFGPDGAFNEESLRVVEGYAERNVLNLKRGDRVQFERFGYCVRDSDEEPVFVFTHR